MYDKLRIRETKRHMRRVLLEQWDPIGVENEPLAQDEYDSYLGGLYDLMAAGVSDLDIAQHLHDIETERMGGSGQSRDKLLSVAQSLLQIPL